MREREANNRSCDFGGFFDYFPPGQTAVVLPADGRDYGRLDEGPLYRRGVSTSTPLFRTAGCGLGGPKTKLCAALNSATAGRTSSNCGKNMIGVTTAVRAFFFAGGAGLAGGDAEATEPVTTAVSAMAHSMFCSVMRTSITAGSAVGRGGPDDSSPLRRLNPGG